MSATRVPRIRPSTTSTPARGTGRARSGGVLVRDEVGQLLDRRDHVRRRRSRASRPTRRPPPRRRSRSSRASRTTPGDRATVIPISGCRLQTPSTSTSARTGRSASTVAAPTSAFASLASVPPSTATSTLGCSASSTAIGGLFVITVASQLGRQVARNLERRRARVEQDHLARRGGGERSRARSRPSRPAPARAAPRRAARRPRAAARRRGRAAAAPRRRARAGRGGQCRARRRATALSSVATTFPSRASRSRITSRRSSVSIAAHSSTNVPVRAFSCASRSARSARTCRVAADRCQPRSRSYAGSVRNST